MKANGRKYENKKNLERKMKILKYTIAIIMLAGSSALANETSSNLDKFFFAGGWLIWPLLVLSIITLHLILQIGFNIRTSRFYSQSLIKDVRGHLRHKNHHSCLELLRNNNSVLSRVLRAGLNEKKLGHDAMENAMVEIIEDERGEFFRKLEWLNIIGNIAPMIGLFGTVWGMIQAFNGIVEAGGRPQPPDLAGGISNALVTTLWGMAVAIPALAASGYLGNRFDALTAKIAVIAEELLIDEE